MKCTFCNNEVASYGTVTINPPVCSAHEDLLVLTERMTELGEPLTPESVAARLAKAREIAPGGWTIGPADVAAMLPGFLAKRKETSTKGVLLDE